MTANMGALAQCDGWKCTAETQILRGENARETLRKRGWELLGDIVLCPEHKMQPLDERGVRELQRVWEAKGLPATDFTHWSAQYARDVWELIRLWTQPDVVADFGSVEEARSHLIEALESIDVWAPDKKLQQWVPVSPR